MAGDGPARESGDLGARLGILLTVVLWSSQYPLIYEMSQRWDAYSMMLIRYCGAAALFLALGRLWPRARRTGAAPTIAQRVLLGGSFAAFAILFTLGLTITHPVTSAAVAAVSPITASLLAWAVAGERPRPRVFLALVLVVPGAALAAVDLSGFQARPADLLGACLILGAQASWAWYSLMWQRWLRGWSQVAIAGRSVSWCLPFVALAYGLASVAGATYADYHSAPVFDAAAFALLTFGAVVLGVLLWNHGVARLGLAVTAVHLNLVPVVAMVISYGLGVVPRPGQILGTLLVIAGVLFARSPAARGRK
jgi:drug/metabolite transporter (DMT)-like permease